MAGVAQSTELQNFMAAKLKGNFFVLLRVAFKDDFQSVLRTLESLFTTFVLFHVRRHKM